MTHHPHPDASALETARTVRNRAAVATASAAVVALTAFGYLPGTADALSRWLTIVALGGAVVAFGGALTVFTRAVFDVIDLGKTDNRVKVH